MYAVGKLGSYISRGVYTVSASFHPFGGAVDIIVVEQEDGSFKTSPWYVRFGKFQGVLKTREKVVSINVNGLDADFHMYLDHKGEAYFLKEVDIEEGEAVVAYQSSSGEDTDGQPHDSLPIKSKSCTITPTSKQLASLNLKDGSNIIIFTFSTAMLGKQQVDARVYLWKWNTRVVISGVDGTITKCFRTIYALGWTLESIGHIRVSHICFQALRKMDISLYISARAISQAYLTRQFLLNLTQDGKTLPDGPVVISPDGLFHSLFRKVIRRAPHEFKIACLEDIKALFPSDISPFYAGFGNSDTDEISYLKGEVAMNRRVDTKSYPYLHSLVHDMFPPMSSTATEQGWDFWKLPPPTL